MTDRAKGCYVAFDKDIRVDDIEPLIEAIKMLRNVKDVELIIADSSDFIARSRITGEVVDKLFKVIEEIRKT